MQRLVELDSVKTRMQDTQQALQVQYMLIDIISISFHFLLHLSLFFLPPPPPQEADNWATLVTDVEEVFDKYRDM